MSPLDLLSLWHRALLASHGICISSPDRQLLREQLYRVRKEAANEELTTLVIIFPADSTQLWIVHRKGEK